MRTFAKWFFSTKIEGDQSRLCLDLSWKNRKNTHKVAKLFRRAEFNWFKSCRGYLQSSCSLWLVWISNSPWQTTSRFSSDWSTFPRGFNTLEKAIAIAQNKDATGSQVGCMQPEFKGNLTQTGVHQLCEKQGARPKQKKQQKETGGSDSQKCTKRETCFNCGAKPAHPRSECPAKKAKCFKCGKDRHYGSVCKSKSTRGSVNKLQTQPIDAPLNKDSTTEDYTLVSVFYCNCESFEDGNGKDS